MATSCCNTTTKEDDGTLSLSSSSQTQRRKKTQKKNNKKNQEKKPRKGKELTFKLLLYLFTFGSRFWPLVFALPFQVLYLGIFFFSNKRKKKHT